MKLTTVVLSAAALVSCGHKQVARTEAAPAAAVAVKTSTAAVQNWPAVYEANGTVRARTTATIASRVMGYVQQVSVQAGDRIRPGQSLVTIEARDLEANLRRAEAGRAEAQSALPEAENAIAAAKANLDLAQATFRRIQELAEKKSVSSQEFDEASARLKAAQATYEMSRAKLPQVQSRIAQADEEQRAARVTLDYAGMAAPFAGVVTARSVEPGNLVAPGAPLLTIEREGSYRLEVEVDESKVAAVTAGKSVKVTLDALGRSFDARVSEVVPAVDAASRAYTVKIDLPPMPEIRSGLSGKAAFALSTRPALAIPVAALQEHGQLQSVFVVENGVARTRLITTGQRFRDAWEVLSGLSAGESVVTGAATLADGARVEVGP